MQFAIQYTGYDNLFTQCWKSRIAIELQNMTLLNRSGNPDLDSIRNY